MREYLTYWRCSHCYGTGRVIHPAQSRAGRCFHCDGTGNAFVDGEAAAHCRRLAELDEAEAQS